MNDNKQNKEDKIIGALADLIEDPKMTPEKLRELLAKAHKKADAKREEGLQTKEAAILDGVKETIKSKNARIVIAANEADNGKIERMNAMIVGDGCACMALLGLAVMNICAENNVSLKDFCDGMLDTEQHHKELKAKEN